MLEKKNLYYIVRNGTKIIYKGKDEKKARMLQCNLNNNKLKSEELKERIHY